jgi:hypothetical protein
LHGLAISLSEGGIRSVATLVTIYSRDGAKVLSRAVQIVRDAFGERGFHYAPVLDGIARLLTRYPDTIDDDRVIHILSNVRGGPNGVLNEAQAIRLNTGRHRSDCFAAAAVHFINREKRGGAKLPSWWTE